jgi:hypothetical protein
MQLPFTREQFFAVFEGYNHAVWPAQFALLLLGFITVAILFRPRAQSGAIASTILAALWAWLGIVYHLLFFSRINPAAYIFAITCLAGASIFLWVGVIRRRVRIGKPRGWRLVVGILLLAYSLLIYPAISWLVGIEYFASPTFGLPCPTTIFTIGVLAFIAKPVPRAVFVVPISWSLVGAQAAFLLGVPQDFGLLVAAGLGVALALRSA